MVRRSGEGAPWEGEKIKKKGEPMDRKEKRMKTKRTKRATSGGSQSLSTVNDEGHFTPVSKNKKEKNVNNENMRCATFGLVNRTKQHGSPQTLRKREEN